MRTRDVFHEEPNPADCPASRARRAGRVLRKAFAAKKGAVEANRRALAAGADYARAHFPCPAPDRPGAMVK